jgi:hypothetical protein
VQGRGGGVHAVCNGCTATHAFEGGSVCIVQAVDLGALTAMSLGVSVYMLCVGWVGTTVLRMYPQQKGRLSKQATNKKGQRTVRCAMQLSLGPTSYHAFFIPPSVHMPCFGQVHWCTTCCDCVTCAERIAKEASMHSRPIKTSASL